MNYDNNGGTIKYENGNMSQSDSTIKKRMAISLSHMLQQNKRKVTWFMQMVPWYETMVT